MPGGLVGERRGNCGQVVMSQNHIIELVSGHHPGEGLRGKADLSIARTFCVSGIESHPCR